MQRWSFESVPEISLPPCIVLKEGISKECLGKHENEISLVFSVTWRLIQFASQQTQQLLFCTCNTNTNTVEACFFLEEECYASANGRTVAAVRNYNTWFFSVDKWMQFWSFLGYVPTQNQRRDLKDWLETLFSKSMLLILIRKWRNFRQLFTYKMQNVSRKMHRS